MISESAPSIIPPLVSSHQPPNLLPSLLFSSVPAGDSVRDMAEVIDLRGPIHHRESADNLDSQGVTLQPSAPSGVFSLQKPILKLEDKCLVQYTFQSLREIKESVVTTGSRLSFQYSLNISGSCVTSKESSHLYCFCFRRKSLTWKWLAQICLRPTALK